MVGWDFSHLEDDGRLVADEVPWDFDEDCLRAMRDSSRIIDLGTGGGERLAGLLDKLGADKRCDKQIIATEGWTPNIPLARQTLAEYGVAVREYDSETNPHMPFPDTCADLIMSRHESFDPAEIARVLVPGGMFMTQQVDGHDAAELHEWFGTEFLYPEVSVDNGMSGLHKAGMVIDKSETWQGIMRFSDIEALIEYMALVPWDVPGFTVEGNAARLELLSRQPAINVTQCRFRIYAHKPQ
jgi:SAM-dependent methyltransferase